MTYDLTLRYHNTLFYHEIHFFFFHQLTKSNSELEILDTVRIQNERNVISFYLILLGIQIVITKFCKKIENSQLEKM